MSLLPPPTQAGFLEFVRTVMGISSDVLPDSSPYLPPAFVGSMEIVNDAINAVAPQQYTWAVYNLGGSNLINYAQDAVNAPLYKNNLPYFAYFRDLWKINNFVTGIVQASSDEGSSTTLLVPESFKEFTLANLQQLKDPYGRKYLSIAQDYGNIWGIT